MKQKLLLLILLLAMAVMACWLYASNQRYQHELLKVQQMQQASKRQVADLNDRLVALGRQQQSSINIVGNVPNASMTGLQQMQQLDLQMQRLELKHMQQHWLQSSLRLAQQSVLQGDLVRAEQMLHQVQTQLLAQKTVDTVEPFTAALLHAIKQDQTQLAQAKKQNTVLNNNVGRTLTHIQQQLLKLSDTPPTLHTGSADADNGVFSTWFTMVRINRVATDTQQKMLSRSLLCKQASFSVGLAHTALIERQPARVSEYVQQALQLIQPLSDASVTALARQLRRVQAQQLPKPVNLASLALVSQQEEGN